jgi:lipopolysaccharide biosynthesis glycosyltransferase
MNRSIWIGFDPREAAAFAVARHSIKRHLTQPIPVFGLVLSDLQQKGLYTRPMEMRPSAADRPVMWDVLSDAPMSTQHANARFLVPHLARSGWALFCDGDMLFRGNVARLFDRLDSSKAVYCVQHRHDPPAGEKMDGQQQTRYARKNWSSFVLFNCDHPSNKHLTLDEINSRPGRDLHRFFWLTSDEIGELGPEWNFLVGHTDPAVDPKVVHFTDGVPDMAGYESVPFADEWRREREDWARGALSFPG